MDFPDLPFLRTFVAVYEARGVTEAASRLHRTQPTVSYQLRRLEETLGAPLFERRSARLVPTPLADRLFRFLGGFARDVQAVLQGVEEDRPLEVASVSGFGRYVLFPLLSEMESLHRSLTLRYPPADEVFRQVLEGRVDVGFSFRGTVHPRLTLTPVYEEKLVLVAGPTWARRLRAQKDFRDVPLVTYDEGDYVVGRWLGHHFGRRHPHWYSTAHFEELEEVLDWVARGRGTAVVPDFCIPEGRGLRVVGWGKPALVNMVHAVQRGHAPVRPVVTELLARLRKPARRAPR
ncbi:LysR family transcriptional regulator [Myxococcus stipitatus DSM 14675]|uniref:LysR family transcriptional regulator n=1 Tax=Myxococcus stipitatus (strain DSM 14675 / JCM 12634 / Mx s8) TaxID=1278073 RepID=L7U4R0_MYXSD|nr:LysR family transcriptional regulator [Myxococcus stipitatus]AGC42532.1 LysR family transcriptional regulator [Myxococcus stipitatus DSM 14675]